MQVLLQLKEYEAFFERMITEKKYNEVENLIHYLKDDKVLESELKKILRRESNFLNILFFIQAFWNNSLKTKINPCDNISINILIDIFNIFLKENTFFLKISKRNPCLLNLINLICIKLAKILKNFEKIRPIIEIIIENFSNKINKRLLCESLRNEGFINESIYYSSILNIHLNFGTDMEIKEIEKIFGTFYLELNENKNDKSSHNKIDDKIDFLEKEQNISFNKCDKNIIIVNKIDKYYDDENLWDVPAFLNNKIFLKNNKNEKYLDLDNESSKKFNNIKFLNEPFMNGIYIKNKSLNDINDSNCFNNICNLKENMSQKNLISNNHNNLLNLTSLRDFKIDYRNKNLYYECVYKTIEPIKFPTQINMRDV